MFFGNPVSMFIRSVVQVLKPIIYFIAGVLVGAHYFNI